MKKLKLFILLSVIISLLSCQSDDETKPNSAPQDFTVSVSDINSSGAKLSWTAAKDADGDKVSYSIKLNNENIAENLSELNYQLTELKHTTNYAVKIIAKDAKGAETISSANFSTTELPSPQDFTISVDNISYTKALLKWTESTISENNSVSYTVFLNGKIMKENISGLSLELTELTHNTNFTGQIKAIADNGKTLTKDFKFKTLQNKAPQTFELKGCDDPGFAYTSFHFNKAKDPENDNLEYRIILNDEDVTDTLFDNSTNSSPIPNNIQKINKLTGSTHYKLKIKAIDPFGNASYSNVLKFTTEKTPPDNFEIRVVGYSPDQTHIAWNTLTDESWAEDQDDEGNPLRTYFSLDGKKHNLHDTYSIRSEKEYILVLYPKLLSPNEDHEVQVVFDWGANNKKSYSNILTVHNRVYSKTTAKVETATLYNSTAEYYPLQFVITFKDSYISEFEDYEILKIQFHDKEMKNFIGSELGARNKIYLTGNITQEDFDYLSKFNDGYVETKDEKGYHALIFYYSVKN